MFVRYPRMTRHSALLAAVLLAACSGGEDEAEPTATPEATEAPTAAPGRIFTYTSLKDCPVLESNPDEAGYFLSECKGDGGYKLRVIESDLRQTIEVIAPDGKKSDLNLSAVTGGGFSHLGPNVEWRGAVKDGAFTPDAMIVRHEVVTNPEGTESESWLVAVKLDGAPCPIARIAPGPQQNQQARDAADAGGACLAGTV